MPHRYPQITSPGFFGQIQADFIALQVLAMRRIAPAHRCCRSGRAPVEVALLCAPVARQVNPALGVGRQRRTPRVASPPPRHRRPGAVPLCCPSAPSRSTAPPLRGATALVEPPSVGVRARPGALPPRQVVRFRSWLYPEHLTIGQGLAKAASVQGAHALRSRDVPFVSGGVARLRRPCGSEEPVSAPDRAGCHQGPLKPDCASARRRLGHGRALFLFGHR